jgi:putative hydrolase of the HAD superfamily
MSPGPVEAVIFDWGGTLTPWHDVDVREKWRLLARAIDQERVEEIADALLEADEYLWRLCDSEHRSATLTELFERARVTPDEAALAEYFEAWSPHTFTDPDVPGLFAGLRSRGIRIGVLSNTMWSREWHERVLARDGVLDLIDGAIYTSEIPWTKPHPEAFRAALAAVGATDPARAVFTGDRPVDDVFGAQRVGMRTILVPHSRVPQHEAVPDATVNRLAEVLPLVDAWRRSA